MSSTPDAIEAREPRSKARLLLEDLVAGTLGILLAIVLLWYLHDQWQPRWAVICGALGGIATRRAVRPSYASFPAYIRRPLSIGVIGLGTLMTSWATLAREPGSYWLSRWREAIALPLLAGIIGLGLAAVIYTHRRLEREIESKRKLEDDLRIASRIQQNLLRGPFPTLPWIETHAVNIASREVGGDYYEFVDAGEAGIVFAVGDVSGKGVPAALLMSSLQSAFLAAFSNEVGLDRVCAHVNRFLAQRTTPERYATFFVGQLTPGGRLRYVNAGHNPALLVGPSGSDRLFGGGMPLGLFEDAEYTLHERRIGPDQILLVYTDGVTEAVDAADEEFGEERLARVVGDLRAVPAEGISDAVLRAVHDHSGTTVDFHDDLTLMILRQPVNQA